MPATNPTTDASDATAAPPAAGDTPTADEPELDEHPASDAADEPPAGATEREASQPEDAPDPTAATDPTTDASDATAAPPADRSARAPATRDDQPPADLAVDAQTGDTPAADGPDGASASVVAGEPADGEVERETSRPDDVLEPAGPASAGGETSASVRAMLGVALVLVAGRFVAAGDPTRPAWLLGYAAAGAGTGLVLAAAVAPGLRLWWRGMAVAGALVVQAGLVLGWSEPMDVTRAGPSAPVVLVAAGALIVALGLWLAPAGPAGDRDPAWPGAAAIGAAVGYGATLAGGARLAAFDIAEHVSPDAEIDGWLTDLAPLVVVAVLATPVALGAIAAAHGSPDPGRVTAALVAVAVIPLAASGGGWTALALAATALAAGAAAARWPANEGAGVAVAAIVLGGTALAGASGAGPTGVLAAALYGGIVGTLSDVAATRAARCAPGIDAS